MDNFTNNGFVHTPLDTTSNSIRLLRILPELSDNGFIQCEMWHSTTDATYTCLSYVWGTETNRQALLVDGEILTCTKNLWDFLCVARDQHSGDGKIFWIDAICIDQASITERNHQVSQMGEVYAKASDVLAWLGCDPGAMSFLKFLKRLAHKRPLHKDDAYRFMVLEEDYWGVKKDYGAFEANEYWKRAWITQEVLQARCFSLMVGREQIYSNEFRALLLLLWILTHDSDLEYERMGRTHELLRIRFTIYVQAMAGDRTRIRLTGTWPPVVERTLLDLLFFLGPRKCQVPRDKVYSLLSIAEDTHDFPVDYSMPEHVVVTSLLTKYSKSLCLCSLARLADIVDCETPFEKSAPQSLLVELLMEASDLDVIDARPSERKAICSRCGRIVYTPPGQYLVFCPKQLCQNSWRGGHLIVPEAMSWDGNIARTFTLLPHDGVPTIDMERMLTFDAFLGVSRVEHQEEADETRLTKVRPARQFSIRIPIESLAKVARCVVKSTRDLCFKPKALLGLNFLTNSRVEE